MQCYKYAKYKDNFYDVILCMGAYYHTHSSAEREQIISECIRVLKPDGILVISYINTAFSDGVMNTGENGAFYSSDTMDLIVCVRNSINSNRQYWHKWSDLYAYERDK